LAIAVTDKNIGLDAGTPVASPDVFVQERRAKMKELSNSTAFWWCDPQQATAPVVPARRSESSNEATPEKPISAPAT
jgi:hypothetical protein